LPVKLYGRFEQKSQYYEQGECFSNWEVYAMENQLRLETVKAMQWFLNWC